MALERVAAAEARSGPRVRAQSRFVEAFVGHYMSCRPFCRRRCFPARRFGSVNFINRAGLVAGDATPEELSAKAFLCTSP